MEAEEQLRTKLAQKQRVEAELMQRLEKGTRAFNVRILLDAFFSFS